MSFTPGPWVLSQNGDDFAIHGGWRGELLVTEIPANGHPRDPHVEADARLIASAPEMLEACERVLAGLDGTKGMELVKAREMMRATIAKAKGES